jgi:hypothetical protein
VTLSLSGAPASEALIPFSVLHELKKVHTL